MIMTFLKVIIKAVIQESTDHNVPQYHFPTEENVFFTGNCNRKTASLLVDNILSRNR